MTVSFESAIVRQIEEDPSSSFCQNAQKYFFASDEETSQLYGLKEFMEKNALPPGRQVDLKNERIQWLFDTALENVLAKDCSSLLGVYQDQKMSEYVQYQRAQDEARKWHAKGVFGTLEATATQIYRKIRQKNPKELEVYERKEESGFLFIESPERSREEIIAILQKWERAPLAMIKWSSHLKKIQYLRNILLPKAAQILLNSSGPPKTYPSLAITRLS